MPSLRTMAGAGGLALLLASAPALADPDYAGYRTGTFLRFLDAPAAGESLRRSPTLGLSFGGRMHRAVMDTGSTGIVVSADMIPNVDSLPTTGPGTLAYSSSGRIMRGDWVVTPVTVSGADGASVTTKPLPVLAVHRIDCFDNARDCTPNDDPRSVVMLGIGFAREGDHQGRSTPDKNPFLNLPGMGTMSEAGPVRRGYVVTREGVEIGLTETNTRGGFHFVKLDKAAGGMDWGPLPACITIADGAPACGTALVDTGVTAMFLTMPPDREAGYVDEGETGGRRLAPGTPVAIAFGRSDSAGAPGYGFAAGDGGNALAPSRIVLVGGERRPTFVNTSVHALNGFDYLYDADGGYVGLRRLSPRP